MAKFNIEVELDWLDEEAYSIDDELRKRIIDGVESALLEKATTEAVKAVDKKIAEKILEAGAGQGWIPVSERLPKKHEDALTTTRYDGFLGRYGTWIETGFINDIGEWSGACIGGKVIAWMPLPEPYKEKTE